MSMVTDNMNFEDFEKERQKMMSIEEIMDILDLRITSGGIYEDYAKEFKKNINAWGKRIIGDVTKFDSWESPVDNVQEETGYNKAKTEILNRLENETR